MNGAALYEVRSTVWRGGNEAGTSFGFRHARIHTRRTNRTMMTDFAGSWDATLVTPIGTMLVVFDIVEDNGVISGVARSDAETVDILDAAAQGNRLTWTQNVTTPMRLTLKFEVTVDGDTMTGAYKAGIFPSST